MDVNCDEPHLGLATTHELLTELEARMILRGTAAAREVAQWANMARRVLSKETLEYRTIDS